MYTNEVPINIFRDLAKAFDTIDHNILLHKLRFYGLDGSTLLLFESCLSNRRQYVEIDEMQSETLPFQYGLQLILMISHKSVVYLTSLCMQMIQHTLEH